jgi:hypothetical protein
MKKVILLVLMCFSVQLASAQTLTKEEKAEQKEWAKKLKTLKPLDYKRMVEEKGQLEQAAQEAKSNLETCTSTQAAKDEEIIKLRSNVDTLQAQLAAAPAKTATGATSKTTAKQGKTQSGGASTAKPGLVFKVQIGSFRNKDLTKYFNNTKNFSGDVDADGTKKYTLGEFAEYWEADNFKKYLREMGVKDAWVVSYKDGNRIPIKDALEGAF